MFQLNRNAEKIPLCQNLPRESILPSTFCVRGSEFKLLFTLSHLIFTNDPIIILVLQMKKRKKLRYREVTLLSPHSYKVPEPAFACGQPDSRAQALLYHSGLLHPINYHLKLTDVETEAQG